MAHDPVTTGKISPQSYQPSWEPTLLFPRTDGASQVWQQDLPEWPRGACWICNTSDPHSAAVVSLSSLLEPAASIPPKFWLSQKACAGILRRASKRGKALPPALEAAAIGNIRVDDVASTITKHTGGGGETQNPAFVVEPVFPTLAMGAHTAAPGGNGQDALQIQQTLSAVGAGRPRRLTPLECERLMSWPDQWTATGRKADGTLYALSDTARYRLCGNGVGSVCAQWIAGRLLDQETP